MSITNPTPALIMDLRGHFGPAGGPAPDCRCGTTNTATRGTCWACGGTGGRASPAPAPAGRLAEPPPAPPPPRRSDDPPIMQSRPPRRERSLGLVVLGFFVPWHAGCRSVGLCFFQHVLWVSCPPPPTMTLSMVQNSPKRVFSSQCQFFVFRRLSVPKII